MNSLPHVVLRSYSDESEFHFSAYILNERLVYTGVVLASRVYEVSVIFYCGLRRFSDMQIIRKPVTASSVRTLIRSSTL